MPTPEEQDKLNSQLIAAITAKDADAVKTLLDDGADANLRSPEGRSALLLAVDSGDARVTALVAGRTQYLDNSDSCDFTAFTQAVRNNKPAVAHALLDAGASPFPPGRGAEYPLDWAVANKMYDVIGRMLKKSGWPDRMYKDEPLIVYAAREDDIALAKACLDGGVNVNRGTAKNGITALHIAAQNGSEKFIALLLENNASLEVTANNAQTPFDWARNNVLRMLVAERDMREAARMMTEGSAGPISVRRPVQFKRTP